MKRLILESWCLLLYIEWALRFREFHTLYRIVREEPVVPTASIRLAAKEELCRAVDYACVFYFKRVFCLQRSLATALLLRRHGWKAEMVLGVQTLPFKSHAWVEVDGVVVNDTPNISTRYSVLEQR
jgi:hypothetical protein